MEKPVGDTYNDLFGFLGGQVNCTAFSTGKQIRAGFYERSGER